MGANKKIEDLADVRRHGFQLGIRCWCGHHGTLDIDETLRWFHCHQWSTSSFACRRHFRCSRCRRKGRVRLGLSADLPVDHGRYPRDQAGWADLVKQLRG
jgi:hypothetical protein